MEDLSEQVIRRDCPHCNPDSKIAFTHPLEETAHFRVVCDAHPLIEGHILIIPKTHLAAIGEYPPDVYEEFVKLNGKIMKFVQDNYGSVATFEHGKYGQMVFHSHVHYLPYFGSSEEIVPEGMAYCTPLESLEQLRQIFKANDGYLYFSIGDKQWTVDTSLAAPRFFRDRFAHALGWSKRGPWKDMHQDPEVMRQVDTENKRVQRKWGVLATG